MVLVTPAFPGRVVTIGEPLVAFISTDGPLATSLAYTSVVTGAEVNVAIGLARLGHEVHFLGLVGSDPLGERILRHLRMEQVGTRYMREVSPSETGLLVREPAVFGPSEVLYRRSGSAGAQMDATYVEECSPAFSEGSWLHITGVTPALSVTCADAVRRAVELARSSNMRVSLDVNMRHRLWDSKKAHEILAQFIAHCDVVFGDGPELDLLAGTSSTTDAVRHLHRLGIDQVVVKRGAAGAVVHSSTSSVVELPGLAVSDIRDLVGAGDAFVAGYLSALMDFEGGLRPGAKTPDYGRGCLAAAFTIRALGDSTEAPTRRRLASADSFIVR